MVTKKGSSKVQPKCNMKKVQFKLYLPDAERVFLAGDFNNWDVLTLPMKKNGAGFWQTNIDLTPGRYEYRFWVNETWHDDPNAHEKAENPYGSQNAVRIVM